MNGAGFDVWDTRYRWRNGDRAHDASIEDTWQRVARALAAAEAGDREEWARRFYAVLDDFRFLPGGRILAGAGTNRRVTLFNCFVMGAVPDSVPGIFEAVKEGAITMQAGGGVGYDFSTLRPAGDRARETGGIASGPVSFMRVWDSMCATIIDSNARRGAMMATLACDHPDIERFIEAKADKHELRHFNLSVLVSDALLAAVAAGAEWPLRFPPHAGRTPPADETAGAPGSPRRAIDARALWRKIMQANYDYAEPGVIFIDRVQRLDNLRYCERITATNPCGEIPLPAYGACDLGSLNLTQFVRAPFAPDAAIDWAALRDAVPVAVRMLDDVYDVSPFPLPVQREVARSSRRIGLGITGLADAFIMLGIVYGDERSQRLAADVMREICHAAYRASIDLARERGAFPAFVAERYLASEFVRGLPPDIRDGIARHGIRNSHLTAIAPAGSISLLAHNVSSGLEPVFAAQYERLVRGADGTPQPTTLVDHAVDRYRTLARGSDGLPPAFVCVTDVAPEAQLAVQAALQPYVDNAISKTVSVPERFAFDRFCRLFQTADRLGLKGCTTYRPNPVSGAVLLAPDASDRCCASVNP